MRNARAVASALVVLLAVPVTVAAGPRDELDLAMRVTSRTGAHDVVEAAGVGLTVALLAHQRQPRVLRAERVSLDGAMLWRVDVAGRDGDGYGCSAIAAWIAEDGEVIRLAKTSEDVALDDCSQWYFDGDELAIEAARDLEDWTPDHGPRYRTDDEWTPREWDEWDRETEEDDACTEADCDGW